MHFVWLTDLQLIGNSVGGKIGFAPDNQSLVNQQYLASLDEIVDWIYVHNLRLIGGASFRARVRKTMVYLECLKRGIALPPEPSEEEWAYSKKLEAYCLPLDEERRIGADFELFDAIGNHEQETIQQLLTDASLVNNRCDVATFWATAVRCQSLTPLLYAIESENAPAAALCIAAGARLNERGPHGMTALHRAVASLPGILRLLIERGAAIEARNDAGLTPLALAVNCANYESMQLLISAGANVNDYHQLILPGSTLRSTASPVLSGSLDLNAAKILYDAGADFQVKTHKGETALHIAAFNNRFALAEFLIEIGCDVNARTVHGETPLTLALKFPGDHAEEAAKFVAQHAR
jgi:ankyrin repeat protein